MGAEEITNQIWEMANRLRGTMDAGEYRNYILGFMFYRYLSEHQEAFLVKNDLVDLTDNKNVNEAYAFETADDLDDYLVGISDSLGYAIAPEYTWATMLDKVHNNKLAPSDFQDMFDSFNNNVNLNPNAKVDFHGVFDDLNLSNSRLGNTTAARTKALTDIVDLVDQIEYHDENGKDILGDIYIYLISKFAENSVMW